MQDSKKTTNYKNFKLSESPKPTIEIRTQDSYSSEATKLTENHNYNGIADYYSYLNNIVPAFLGFQFLSVAIQIPIISNACNILPRACVKNWVTLISSSEENTKDLQNMQAIIDKKYKIQQKVKNYLKNSLAFGGALFFFDIKGQDPAFPLNVDAIQANSFLGVRDIDLIMANPLLNEESNDPLSEWYFEPYAWAIAGGSKYSKVHHSHLSKCVPEPVAPILKPTFRYFGLSVTQKLLPYAIDNVAICKELQQLLKTKRHKVLSTDTATLFSDLENMKQRLESMTTLQNNYNLSIISSGSGFSDGKDELFQLDTSLSDVTQIVDKSYEICASIANIPISKLLGSLNRGGLGNTGDFDLNSWHETVAEFQEVNMREFLEKFYKIAFVSEFGKPSDFEFELVFNPIDEVTQKEIAEIRALNNTTLQNLVSSEVITIEEARSFLLNDKNSGFNDLPKNEIDELGPDYLGTYE